MRGIIFDLDGTLVDSALDFDAMRRDMGLPPRRPILEALADVPAGPDKDRMLAILRDHETRGADRAVLFPGVRAALDFLAELQVPSAILTRNSRASTERVLQRLELCFSQVLTREDAPPKPDPTGLLTISRTWRIPTDEIAFCGDFRFDLEAGRRAGMRTILYAPADLPEYADLADFVLRCFTEFPQLWRKLDER